MTMTTKKNLLQFPAQLKTSDTLYPPASGCSACKYKRAIVNVMSISMKLLDDESNEKGGE